MLKYVFSIVTPSAASMDFDAVQHLDRVLLQFTLFKIVVFLLDPIRRHAKRLK